jgi:Asp-tRNA(Asn)/Glu-tRNA(Gln) amidotransferase A subunit family amidase
LVACFFAFACARSTPLAPSSLHLASIRQLQAAMQSGAIASRELVELFLARIDAFDRQGPAIAAMIALNPRAIEEAEALDRERAERGPRGPLHGIPIVVKDNYDVAGMATTDGARALAGMTPPDDAFQIARLREAGAVILGKTNMHEFARGITTIGSMGGQTLNPYDPTRNPGGSSGGTGAAVAAGFAVFGLGSDTCGSIRIPASHGGLVGLRPTRGLSSRDGVVPLSSTQDVAGPIARTVEDLAIALDATVGFDPADPVTSLSVGRVPASYAAFLDPDGLRGARIGLLLDLMGTGEESAEIQSMIRAAAARMTEADAEVIEIDIPGYRDLIRNTSVINDEFKFDLQDYLAATPGAPHATLESIHAAGLHHPSLEGTLQRSMRAESRTAPEYLERLARRERLQWGVLAAMAERDLDALLYPTMTREPAPIGQAQGGTNCALSAQSGLPAISVPMGLTIAGLPIGLELLGRPFDEPTLLRLAHAWQGLAPSIPPPPTTPRR